MKRICCFYLFSCFLFLAAGLLSAAPDRLARLEAEIARHDHLYWERLSPVITDEAYDALVAERDQLLGQATLNTPVYPADSGTFRHQWPMLSLQKLHSVEDLERFIAGILRETGSEDVRFRLEPKFDGVALNLIYRDGKWVKAITRGDGSAGQDVTENVRTITQFPHILKGGVPPEYLEIRGELFATNQQFQSINNQRLDDGAEPYRQPRHLAAASLRMNNLEALATRRLSFAAFDIKSDQSVACVGNTQSAIIEQLMHWGFQVPDNSWSNVKPRLIHQKILDFADVRTRLPYPTDGLVIKLENRAQQQAFGRTQRAPRYAAAWKYPGPTAITTVIDIVNSIGETGRITPVARVTPVFIDNIQIQNISLHSPNYQQALGIQIGSQIKVHLAGGVIPAILKVLDGPDNSP